MIESCTAIVVAQCTLVGVSKNPPPPLPRPQQGGCLVGICADNPEWDGIMARSVHANICTNFSVKRARK